MNVSADSLGGRARGVVYMVRSSVRGRPSPLRIWSIAFGLIAASAPAHAQQDGGAGTMDVAVEVVHATRQGTKVDPPSLGWLKHQFAEQGINVTAFRRLAEHHLTLEPGKP